MFFLELGAWAVEGEGGGEEPKEEGEVEKLSEVYSSSKRPTSSSSSEEEAQGKAEGEGKAVVIVKVFS